MEKTMPELWPYVSSCKSPHMMLGALLKRVTHDVWGGHGPEDVYLCSVMPCVRKKGESMVGFALPGVRLVTRTVIYWLSSGCHQLVFRCFGCKIT